MSTPPPQGQNQFAQGQNPYGQQAPPQGGYGYPPQQGQQPGVPPQPSPYFNQGAPGPIPPQRPRRSGKTYLRIGGAIVGLIVIVGGWYASRDDADTAKVGDCMSIGNPDDSSNPDLEVVDCGSAKAKYKVAQKKDGTGGCDHTKYSEYTESGDGSDFTLCLTDYTPKARNPA